MFLHVGFCPDIQIAHCVYFFFVWFRYSNYAIEFVCTGGCHLSQKMASLSPVFCEPSCFSAFVAKEKAKSLQKKRREKANVQLTSSLRKYGKPGPGTSGEWFISLRF